MMGSVWRGFRVAVGLVASLPFLVPLVPMWWLYRVFERRAGREVPPWPWVAWRAGRRGRGRDVTGRTLESLLEAELSQWERSEHGGVAREEQVTPGADPRDRQPGPRGVALVTGGGRRVGAAICRDLGRLGYAVAVGYHQDRASAEAVVSGIVADGGVAGAFPLDLNDPATLDGVLDAVESGLGGRLALLVNGAARFEPTPLEGAGWEEMGALLRVNLQGPLWLSLGAAGRMRGRGGGLIVQIADLWGERPLAGYALYGASKAGLLMVTRVLARDLAPEVRVNAIAPGALLPPETGADEGYRRLLARTPLAGLAGPEAVVKAVRYLVTADYVTGEVLHVDGGRGLV
ncbi:MAG: SDR family oxidoreductase [Magnetococcales bacterium]|nr:SDR family oxidoreductase [Magnetococcales bacterium]